MEETGGFEEVAEEGIEEQRKRGKRKRRVKTIPLPTVLKYLNGDEVIALLNYLHNMYWEWFSYFQTIAYTKTFDNMLYRYLTTMIQAPPTEQQPQQPQPPTEYQPPPQPMIQPQQPLNPLDALILNFVSKVVDRVYQEVENKIITNPKFREELENIVRVVATTVAQEVITKQLTQQQPPPTTQ